MPKVNHRLLRECGAAVVSTGLACLLTTLLWQALNQSIFILFILAILISATYGGLRAGLLATILSAALADYYFLSPYQFLWPIESIAPLCIFVLLGLLITLIVPAGRSAQASLPESIRVKNESLALLEALLSSAPIGIAFHDLEGRYVRINEKLAAINGLPVQQHIGRRLSELVPGIGKIKEEKLRHVLETGEALLGDEISGETPAAPGQLRHWVASYYPVRTHDGTIIGTGILVSEVTKQKRIEQDLSRNRKLLQSIVDNSPALIYIKDLDGRFMLVNNKMQQLFGAPQDAIIGKTTYDFVTKENADRHSANDRAVIATDDLLLREEMNLEADGVHTYYSAKFPLHGEDGKPFGVGGISVDITDRKRDERRMRLQASALEAAANAIIITDTQGTIEWVNSAFTSLTGYTREEVLGQNPRMLKSGEHDELFYQRLWQSVLAGHVWQGEMINRRKDGRLYDEEMTITPVLNEAGEVTNFIAIKQNVTERKRMEMAQRVAEEKYRTIFENALEGMFQSTPSGQFLTVNPALARMLGYESAEQLINETKDIGRQLYLNDERQTLMRIIDEQGSVQNYEVQMCCRDGSKLWTSENVRAVRDQQGKLLYYEGTLEDITQRKQLEEQLRHAQKLEAIGRLAGGVAHDFNNLLTVIIGYSQMSLDKLDADHTARLTIEEVLRAGQRAAGLTSQLLAFSRRQVFQPKLLDLNDIIMDLQKMLCRLIGEDIHLITALEPDSCFVETDLGQIQQVIMNLAVNARDAMPNGGHLTIETACVRVEAEQAAQVQELDPGLYARLRVSDTGCGMDQETLSHIFEPFFTTKELGKGTGLGLAMVYGIIKQSGGQILVNSQPGQGTTFIIYLRCARRRADIDKASPKTDEARGGSETILLVEDDEAVKGIAAQTLRGRGYTVWEACNAKEALDFLREHCVEEALLLATDIVMPGMNGIELADQVRRLRPETLVLFVSGYPERGLMKGRQLSKDQHYLHKPFTPSQLLCKVREVFDERPALASYMP